MTDLVHAIERLDALLAERDRRYEERFRALESAAASALAAHRELIDATFTASEKAIAEAKKNADSWQANANEWRESMLDREEKFASKAEVASKFENVLANIASLKESRAAVEGSGAGARAMWGYVIAALSLLGMLITIWVALLRAAN